MAGEVAIMRTALVIIVTAAVVCLVLFANAFPGTEQPREPAVSGQFYPGTSKQLDQGINAFLKDAVPASSSGKPVAIVVPHAGYIFSGQIAADAFNQVAGQTYDTIVILGTNHTTAGFDRIGLFPGTGFRTPMGTLPVDQEIVNRLAAKDPNNYVKDASVHAREHSIEVELPFIQHLFPKARIVPIVVAVADVSFCTRFGKALAEGLKGRRALIVASSDLSHYPAPEDATRVDAETLRAIVKMDPAAVHATIQQQMGKGTANLATCACGEGAILAALAAARELGANQASVISYANSGDDLVGEPGRSVGYGAVLLAAGKAGSDAHVLDDAHPGQSKASAAIPLTKADQQYLTALARKTIEQFLNSETLPLVRNTQPRLQASQGAFVTLTTRSGDLRGCIGHMAEDWPLAKTVAWAALQAAFNDQRFEPVKPSEWPGIRIEVSVLSPAKPASGPDAIVVGRDGVLLEKDNTGAVFLPQVAPEQGWSRDEMLDHLCVKAGLKDGCWKSGAKFRTFQADVFHE